MTGVFKAYRDPEYQKLLDEDKDVERWYQNLSKGSVIVADIYLRRLGSFCRENKITPGKLAKLPVAKIENLAMDFINDFETKKTNPETGKKYAPGYIESHLKAIKSWASWKGKPFRRKIKVRNSSKRPTLEDERSPTQQELHSVLYAASTPLRARVSISLTAFSGPRLEVQGDYLGLDGLRI